MTTTPTTTAAAARPPSAIGVATLDQVCVVCCHGPLDGPEVADLRHALRTAAQLSSTVLLEARDVAQVGSAALAVLVATRRLLHARQGTLRLAAPAPVLERALARAGLHALLPVSTAGLAGWIDPCHPAGVSEQREHGEGQETGRPVART